MAVEAMASPQESRTLADEFSAIADSIRRSTVHVQSERRGSGSGVIWRPDGFIITNAHVVDGPAASVELWDGRTFEAQVLARDAERDLAALSINAADLPAATIADSDRLRVGQLVAAAGNPLGLSGAVSLGIIHAIAPVEGRQRQLEWVQADVQLLPGNSGGPLADARGYVIGINSMVAGGLGLAVPSNAVSSFIRRQRGTPHLGVTMQPLLVPLRGERKTVNGLLILSVAAGSPAERSGLLLGDILIGARGQRFSRPGDLTLALQDAEVERTLQLELVRGGNRLTREVTVPGANDVAAADHGNGVAA